MEIVQIVLLLVIVILTVLLAVLGIQVFLILREIRKTMEKTNKVLDNAGIIVESISTPISTLSSLAMSIKTGISFANWLKKTYSLLLHQTSHKETKEPPEEKSEGVMAPKRPAKELNGDLKPNAQLSEEERKSREAPSVDGGNAGSGSARPMIRRFFRGIGKKIKI